MFFPFVTPISGFIDPLTGEGIHLAQEGGRIAANFLNEALEVGNFDAAVMKEYQNRWMNEFGHDFKWLVLPGDQSE